MYTITEGDEFTRTRLRLLLELGLQMQQSGRIHETKDCNVLQIAAPTDMFPRAVFADALGLIFLANYGYERIDSALSLWRHAIGHGKDNVAGVAEMFKIPELLPRKISWLHHQTTLWARDIVYLLKGKTITSLETVKREQKILLRPERPVA